MQVTQEPLEPCQVALTIEVEPDKVVHAVDRAYREYAKYIAVPGFRKGKAPMNFVRQRVPESDVRQRAAELLVEPAYAAALEQEKIQPYAPPKLELVQLDLTEKPFIFKAVVPLAPQVELGAYTGLAVERPQYEVTPEDVEKQLERLRERAADYPQVERPAQTSDLVIADVAAIVESRPDAADPRPTMLEIGTDNIPGFDDQIVGMNAGETKTFSLTYPPDYPEEDLAGQDAEFTVTAKEVRAKEIPPLDDDLAKKISNGKIETLDALRADLESDMRKTLTQSAERETEGKLVDNIVQNATVKFPPVLVEAEVDDDVKDLLARLEGEKVSLEDYLEQTGKSREQLLAEIQDAAFKRITIGLVLGEIAQRETLALTDADLDAELAIRAEAQRTTPAAMRAFLESNNQLDAARNRAQTKKVLDFLRASAIITDKPVRSGDNMEESNERTTPHELTEEKSDS